MWLGSWVPVAVVQAGSCSSSWPLAWELPYATSMALKKKIKYRNTQSWKWNFGQNCIEVCLIPHQSIAFLSRRKYCFLPLPLFFDHSEPSKAMNLVTSEAPTWSHFLPNSWHHSHNLTPCFSATSDWLNPPLRPVSWLAAPVPVHRVRSQVHWGHRTLRVSHLEPKHLFPCLPLFFGQLASHFLQWLGYSE